jgi:hypothetical protein
MYLKRLQIRSLRALDLHSSVGGRLGTIQERLGFEANLDPFRTRIVRILQELSEY